jgi:hypothetical protein
MRWRPVLLTATVGFVVAVWATPAMAKGPDQATITGPGLDAPIVVTGWGEPGTSGNLVDLADGSGLFVMMFDGYDSSGRVETAAPTGSLGPRFELAYRVPDGTSSGSTVRQDLYPLAAGGPVTYTEAGQSVFGSTTSGGWYRPPGGFSRVLEGLGLATSTTVESQPEPAPVRQPTNPPPSATPWLPILVAVGVAAVAIAAVLFGRWRAGAGRRGASVASGG